MTLPSLEVLTAPRECDACGELFQLISERPWHCAACSDRLAMEGRRESGNDYRRQAQIRYELHEAGRRARKYQESKVKPLDYVCVTCDGRGGFAGGQDDGKECPDCQGLGVIR